LMTHGLVWVPHWVFITSFRDAFASSLFNTINKDTYLMIRNSLFAMFLLFGTACGDDGTEADRLGVGAECTETVECDEDTNQECLREFTGGYCGIMGCVSDEDCPDAAACIAQPNGNYCFRICADKAECNENRSVENESNCSSNITFTDGANGRKACVPPSSGT
jgi:hypothetical protein